MSLQTSLRREPCDDPPDLTDTLERIQLLHAGRGTFGVIYKYRFKLKGESRLVAVKCFNDCPWGVNEATYTRRLRRVLEIWKRLSHGNIVPLLGIAFVANPEFPCPVSEWMPNGTLSEYVDRHKTQLDATRRLRLAEGVAAGLKHLHSHGVIHGDLSDTNILLDGDNEARLTDFAIAGVLGDLSPEMAYLQISAQRAGALMWAAPELVAGDSSHATVQSDMYSFGSIMLFIMTGSRPWPRNELFWIPLKLKEGQNPRRPQSPSIPDPIWMFIVSCWSHSAAQRPAAREALDLVSRTITDANDTSSRAVSEELPISSEGSLTSVDTVLPPSSPCTSDPPDIDDESEPDDGDTNLPSPIDPKLSSQPDSAKQPISTSPSARTNIILFGETGVGKSSVINLIAGETIADVSPDVEGCTMASKEYKFNVGSKKFCIWDTVGLEDSEMGINGYLVAIEKALVLINRLADAGGVNLLLFCMRGNRITATMQNNYKLFYEVLCGKQVPIALVITHLEREMHMEDWWTRNEKSIEKYGIKSAEHACVTGVDDRRANGKYAQSGVAIHELLRKCDGFGTYTMPAEAWFVKLLQGLGADGPPKGKKLMETLTKRCRLEPEVASRIMEQIE